MSRDDEWQNAYARAVYDVDESPTVLRNKLDIRDYHQLEKYERHIAAERFDQGLPIEALEQTSDGLRALHKHLFQDVYDWAGEYRTYPTARNPNSSFSLPDFIPQHTENTFKKLAEENCLKNLSPENFAVRAASYVNEINAIHPFIDGNGRVQRIWLQHTADSAGYQISFHSHDRQPWNQMSMLGQMTADNPERGYMADHPMRDFICSKLQENDQITDKSTGLDDRLEIYKRIALEIEAEQAGRKPRDQDNGQSQ